MDKAIQQIGEIEGAFYVSLESTPMISLKRAHENTQKCEEKHKLYPTVDDPLDSKIKGVPAGTLVGAPKYALTDFHKDAQEDASEATLKGALEVVFELHLSLHLLMQPLIQKCIQNGFI